MRLNFGSERGGGERGGSGVMRTALAGLLAFGAACAPGTRPEQKGEIVSAVSVMKKTGIDLPDPELDAAVASLREDLRQWNRSLIPDIMACGASGDQERISVESLNKVAIPYLRSIGRIPRAGTLADGKMHYLVSNEAGEDEIYSVHMDSFRFHNGDSAFFKSDSMCVQAMPKGDMSTLFEVSSPSEYSRALFSSYLDQ